MVSIVTPWCNRSDLCQGYAEVVRGAEVVVVDNASEMKQSLTVRKMVEDLGGVYVRNECNVKFARACDQGINLASGDIVVCLNSDVVGGNAWLRNVEAVVKDEGLYGPIVAARHYGLNGILVRRGLLHRGDQEHMAAPRPVAGGRVSRDVLGGRGVERAGARKRRAIVPDQLGSHAFGESDRAGGARRIARRGRKSAVRF